MDPNPYQSPNSDGDGMPQEDSLYTHNAFAASYAELWRISPRWPHFIFAAVMKTLRLRLPDPSAFKPFQPVKVISESELPAMAREALLPMVAELRQLEMELAFYGTEEREDRHERFAAHFLSGDGTTIAIALWSATRVLHINKESSVYGLQSHINDGTILVTSNRRRMLNGPAIIQEIYMPGANLIQLDRCHRERLQSIGLDRIRRLRKTDLLQIANENRRQNAEHYIRRKLWIPRPEVDTVDAVL